MRNALEFELDWHDDSKPKDCEMPSLALANMRINVGGTVATKVESLLDGDTRPSIRVNVYHAAVWFAYNWWRLCWEPERQNAADWQMAHNLATAGGGFVWPHLTFASDGQTIAVGSHATGEEDNVSVRYLNSFSVPLEQSVFEVAVEDFIECVTSRLGNGGPECDNLAGLWSEVCEERNDPDKTAWRKLEALLGFDPDKAPEDVVASLQAGETRWGTQAVAELAAAKRGAAKEQLDKLDDMRRQNTHINVRDAEKLRGCVAGLPDTMQPWEKAEQAAAQARQQWALPTGTVGDGALAELFDVPVQLLEHSEPKPDVMNVGFRNEANTDLGIVLNRGPNTGRRFALARLVEDYLASSLDDRLLPATSAKTARQKFQRAFAQEFLCPFDSLRAYINTEEPDDDDIEAAAGHFAVSPRLVATTLVNHNLLERQALVA